MFNSLDIPMPFIENSINVGIQIASNLDEYSKIDQRDVIKKISNGNDLKNIYFVGRTLFLDVCDEFGNSNCITICYADEDFGYFTGGLRRLLSIPALKLYQTLADLCSIQYEKKDYL